VSERALACGGWSAVGGQLGNCMRPPRYKVSVGAREEHLCGVHLGWGLSRMLPRQVDRQAFARVERVTSVGEESGGDAEPGGER
jgi:hypothetical protein